MTVIREDIHGLYALIGGYCFRPDFPRAEGHVHPSYTSFVKGMKVSGVHHGGTQLGTLTDKDTGVKEKWFSHGSYYSDDGSKVSSELLHRPSYECW